MGSLKETGTCLKLHCQPFAAGIFSNVHLCYEETHSCATLSEDE